jgi:AAA domain
VSGEPQLKKIGDSYFVATPEAALEFSALREHSDGLSAEITATAIVNGACHWSRINLASAVARNGLNKALAVACAPVEWNGLLDTACRLVAKAERTGEPSRLLVAAPPEPDQWLVRDFIPKAETTVIYGDGGVAKSLLVTAFGIAGLTGLPIGGTLRWSVARLTAVLILDWESRYQDHAGRLWGLTGGDSEGLSIYYQAMSRPLVEMISSVRRDVAKHGIDLVIVDSLGAASGSEPEGSDSAIRTMNALRSLAPASRLVVAHVSKLAADQAKGTVRP